MDRDYQRIFTYGEIGTGWPGVRYNEMAEITYGDSKYGDAYPLRVFSSEILSFSSAQSTDVPSALNSISVTFATSMPLLTSSRVIFLGLENTQTMDPTLMSDFNGTQVQATWTHRNGSLVLSPPWPIVAGKLYTFSFVVMNPPSEQDAPILKLTVDTCGCASCPVPWMNFSLTLPPRITAPTSTSSTRAATSSTTARPTTSTTTPGNILIY